MITEFEVRIHIFVFSFDGGFFFFEGFSYFCHRKAKEKALQSGCVSLFCMSLEISSLKLVEQYYAATGINAITGQVSVVAFCPVENCSITKCCRKRNSIHQRCSKRLLDVPSNLF